MQNNEVTDNDQVTRQVESIQPRGSKICKWENTRKCKHGAKCTFVHPVGTCKLFSMYGFCLQQASCPHRHPERHCFEWGNTGKCRRNDQCHFRHEMNVKRRDTFLGLNPIQDVPKTFPASRNNIFPASRNPQGHPSYPTKQAPGELYQQRQMGQQSQIGNFQHQTNPMQMMQQRNQQPIVNQTKIR